MNELPENPNFKTRNQKYDLEERTGQFGECIIELCKSIPQTNITHSLVSQLIRSGTSIGANYMEANGAESKKDFSHKISICKKEAKETMHWLRMLVKSCDEKKDTIYTLWKEAHELTLIFSSILHRMKRKF